MSDEMDNAEWLRKSSQEEWCGSALNKCADENIHLREMLEPFAKAYNDTIAATSLAPRFVKKGHGYNFEEENFRKGCGLTEMYELSDENRSLTIKNVVLSQENTRLSEENAQLREALEPFAKAADKLDGQPDRQVVVMLKDCRAARAAIAKARGETGENLG